VSVNSAGSGIDISSPIVTGSTPTGWQGSHDTGGSTSITVYAICAS